MSQAFHGGRIREAQAQFGRTHFVDFSVNTNAFWSPPSMPGSVHLSDAVRRYPQAAPSEVGALLAKLEDLPHEQLIPTAGAIEGLYLAARLFSGKRATVFNPSFADYSRACKGAEINISPLALFPEPPSFEQLISHIEASDLVVLGNPNNPTGRLFPDLHELIRHPRLAHLSWIVDEAFIEFTCDHLRSSLIASLGELRNVIVLRALTKSWGIPGLRLGFLATGNPSYIERLRSMQAPWPISGVTEAWCFENLTRENRDSMLRSLSLLPSIRAEFVEGIASIKGLKPFPSNANFLLVESASRRADEIFNTTGSEGFLIRVCQGFGELDPDRFFRVAVRSDKENQLLLESLEKTSPLAPPRRRQPRSKAMRAISVLGTSSNSGKSWVATALCAWLKRRGLNVAPFKAQNMSNNSAATADGGEIGRAQAAQAEACGLLPCVRMNPILLKPSGVSGSQLIRLGKAEGHINAKDYYKQIESLWPTVTESLSYWQSRCDALVIEGAGSPVELNLMDRDMANLRPIEHLNSRWVLVADIERGGVFAQAAGTWSLLKEKYRSRCMGLIVNKFRGDLSLFAGASDCFIPHFGAPLLGTLPYVKELQPENEDSLSHDPTETETGCPIHWIKLPHLSNSQDTNPWLLDEGVRTAWTDSPKSLSHARVIVLPGSKNTIADLKWLKSNGLADAIKAAHNRGALVVGICGGLQMLGEFLHDQDGVAGDKGSEEGLGFLPLTTQFDVNKEVNNVEAIFQGERWMAYEIHMGRTSATRPVEPLLQITGPNGPRDEGYRSQNVWGTYLHGFFEATQVRRELARAARLHWHRASTLSFRKQREDLYNSMADVLENHLNLEEIWRYVAD